MEANKKRELLIIHLSWETIDYFSQLKIVKIFKWE